MNDLAAGDIGVCRVSQKCGHKSTSRWDSRSRVRSIEDMVLEKSNQKAWVGSKRSQSLLADFCKGRIRGRQDGNVSGAVQKLQDGRGDESLEHREILRSIESSRKGRLLSKRKAREGGDGEVLEHGDWRRA